MSWLSKWAEVSLSDFQPAVLSEVVETLTLIISPFLPHLAEEIWHMLGHEESITFQSWPSFDELISQEKEVEIIVQINGKKRTKLYISFFQADDQEMVERSARATEPVRKISDSIKRVIFVPNRIINFVTGP